MRDRGSWSPTREQSDLVFPVSTNSETPEYWQTARQILPKHKPTPKPTPVRAWSPTREQSDPVFPVSTNSETPEYWQTAKQILPKHTPTPTPKPVRAWCPTREQSENERRERCAERISASDAPPRRHPRPPSLQSGGKLSSPRFPHPHSHSHLNTNSNTNTNTNTNSNSKPITSTPLPAPIFY